MTIGKKRVCTRSTDDDVLREIMRREVGELVAAGQVRFGFAGVDCEV